MQNSPNQSESSPKEEAAWHETRGTTASIGRILLGVVALVVLLWLLDT